MSMSENLVAAARRAGLHPITWLVILAGGLHMFADLLAAVRLLFQYPTAIDRGQSGIEVIASIVHSLAYSMSFFGSAAVVEFLYRIWMELRLRRTPDQPTQDSPA